MKLRTESSLSLFIVISVALHLTAGVALLWFVPEKKPPRREGPYIVRIVPVEPSPPVLEDRPPKALEKPPAPQPSLKKKARPPAKPKRLADKTPEAKPPAEKAPPEKWPEAEIKEAKKTVPAKEGGLPGADATPAAPTEGPGEMADKGKADAGIGKAEEAGRERLFDPEVLSGVIAKKERERPPKPDSSITFDTREIRHYSYMRKLKARIEAVWDYPGRAAKEGIYGDLVIRFVIKEDGSLGAVELVRTSGWRMLDKAAIEALRDGAPYWPLPEEWGTDSLTVTGHFIYTLYGYYYVR